MAVSDNLSVLAIVLAQLIPLVIALIVGLVCAFVGMNMAKSRGMQPVPAFFLGLFTGFIGLIIIALTPKKIY